MAYVTLEQAKDHLRVNFDDDDEYIEGLISVAETSILNEIKGHVTGLGTVTTNGTTALVGDDDTEFLNLTAADTIRVSGETVRTIATITDDSHLTVSSAFSTSESGLSYYTVPSPLESGVLPKPLSQAMLLMIGQLYENREPVIAGVSVSKVPYTVEMLIAPYKTWVVK